MSYKVKVWGIVWLILVCALNANAQCISGNCQTGEGIFKYPNGEVYKGHFKNGQREGQGRLTDKQKHVLYDGYWYPDEQKKSNRTVATQQLAMYYNDGKSYVNAEHAFYRAPLRNSVAYAAYSKILAGKDDYYIVIEKSKYLLDVYNANDELVISYPVVFGNDDLADKMCEGDRRTPEGTFYILGKKTHAKWDKYFALSYPSEESYQKFNERKARGQVAANASIGGGIGLHGTWASDDIAVDRRDNWTSGCISTKNCYIDELFSYIPVGTKVIIRK